MAEEAEEASAGWRNDAIAFGDLRTKCIGEQKASLKQARYRCVTQRHMQYGLDERDGQLEMVWILEFSCKMLDVNAVGAMAGCTLARQKPL